MLRRRDGRWTCTLEWGGRAIASVGVVALGWGVHGRQPPHDSADDSYAVVGRNVLVSADRPTWHRDEVQIASDPRSPDRLMACVQAVAPEANANRTSNYLTIDGGQTWRPVLEVGTEGSSADPSCAIGIDGSLYAASILFAAGKPPSDAIQRSADGGATWTRTNLEWLSREYVTIDQSDGSRRGRVYVHGIAFQSVLDPPASGQTRIRPAVTVLRSDDAGASFTRGAQVGVEGRRWIAPMGPAAALEDGSIILTFGDMLTPETGGAGSPSEESDDRTRWTLKALRTADGEVFDRAGTIAEVTACPFGSYRMPSIAADRSHGPFAGRIYVAWPDASAGRCNVLVSYSTDRGQTWSRPVVVNDDRPSAQGANGPDDFMPSIAVNRDGVVGATWYDRRADPSNVAWHSRFAASFDGGVTFRRSVQISEEANTPSWDRTFAVRASASRSKRGVAIAATVPFEFRGGDTSGLVADAAGRFHAVWVDNRTGTTQMWTARIEVREPAHLNGAATLAPLAELGDRITLELAQTSYDPRTRVVALTATLRNVSRDTVRGPLKGRVLSVESSFGNVAVRQSELGDGGPGSIVDLAEALSTGVLAPGERSRPVRLELQYSRVGRLTMDASPPQSLFSLELALFGMVARDATIAEPVRNQRVPR